MDLVRLVLRLGLEYEDVEQIALEVCELLLQFEGYRGDIICPGVVPNYGPHVSYVRTHTHTHTHTVSCCCSSKATGETSSVQGLCPTMGLM